MFDLNNPSKKIRRKYFLLFFSALIAIAIIAGDWYPVRSQVISDRENNPQVELESVDLDRLSETITRLETQWERDYEGYFGRNFKNQARSAKQIAQHLKDIKERAKINPAVIWAAPQDDFLQLMAITPEGQFISKQIRGARQERLDRRIKELQIAIARRRPPIDYLPPARIIYNWLFRPLDPYLEAEQIDTILLCTGQNLRSFPFAVLHDGEQFVIEKYNLARIPAFGLTDTSYAPRSNRQVLATGASEFEDLPSLPGVEVELDTIVPQLWSGEKMLNQEFTLQNLKRAHQTGQFDIIHIASHSLFSKGSPENSYIHFGDRKLTLDRLDRLRLDLPPVDLLVLSACETALGDEQAEFGFAGLAMQAGVKSALASLWTISDAGTVILMSEFYQELKSTPIKAEALRKAQLRMLQKDVYVEGTKIRGSDIEVNLPNDTSTEVLQNFDHPFYWAGFTIIGNPW